MTNHEKLKKLKDKALLTANYQDVSEWEWDAWLWSDDDYENRYYMHEEYENYLYQRMDYLQKYPYAYMSPDISNKSIYDNGVGVGNGWGYGHGVTHNAPLGMCIDGHGGGTGHGLSNIFEDYPPYAAAVADNADMIKPIELIMRDLHL
jgi:hypothetical protein